MRRLILLCILLLPPPLSADTAPCSGLNIRLESPTSTTAVQEASICKGAASAIKFLAELGLSQQRMITIQLVDHPLDTKGHPIYGSYDDTSDRIRIMTLASIKLLNNPEMYDEPFDEAHYQGVVAHEVSHALVQHNTALARISNSAQEYLAHATQLASLPAGHRQRIIDRAGVGPWQVNDQISEIYMAFAPARFAVKCYLHLTNHVQPKDFVRYLLSYKWRYITVT